MKSQKPIKRKISIFRIAIFLFFVASSNLLLGQYANAPRKQWSTSVDIPKLNNIHEEDWALAMIETEEGNLLAVGFSQGVVSSSVQAPERRLPAWVMLDPSGKHIADGIIDFGVSFRNGTFYELIEGNDGFYFIGKKIISDNSGNEIALAKINKSTLALEYTKTIKVNSFAVNGFGKGIDIVRDQNGNETGLVICGFENVGNGSNGIIIKTDMDGAPTGTGGGYEHWILSGINDLDDEIISCKVIYDSNNSPESIAFTGYQSVQDHSFEHDQTNDPNNGISTYFNSDGIIDFPGNSGLNRTITRIDTDVIVGRINYSDFSNGPDFLKTFNSGTVEGVSPSSSDLFTAYPREFTTEYGPGTPGRTLDNNDPNCEDYNTNPTDPNCCYSEIMDDKFALNSNDRGAKLLISNVDGHIIISTWLNAFVIDGDPSLWRIQNNMPLLMLGSEFDQDHSHEPVISSDCNSYDYTHYYDAECYLLKVNINDGSLLDAKHVAHLSGGDFNTPLRQEGDGSLVVGGTTSDMGFTDLPDAGARFANFLIKTDPNFNISWRHHFLGLGDGNCLFGLTTTQDGGYAICGNNGDKDPATGEEIENYNFVKLGPDCVFDESFDIDEPEYILTESEVWVSDKKINSLIKIPAGLTLTIDGSGSQEGINIEFAYSKLTRDFDNRVPVGISVEEGGVLRVIKANLKGMDICGGEQMWDGIMVKGDPTAPATSAVQGRMYIRGDSKIENAITGILMDEFTYAVETIQIDGDESNGITGVTCTAPKLKTSSNKGGGYLQANDSGILNCRDGIVFHWMNYNNLSTLDDIKFVCDHTMLDEDVFVEEGVNGRLLGTRAFVTMVEVQNINFNQCSFNGNINLDQDLRGTGIESFGSRYSVVGSNGSNNPTEFKDLKTGVETFASELGSVGNSIDLKRNNFFNVLNGVNLRNSAGSEINENNFNNIPSIGWGIYCIQSSAFDISFNNFVNLGIIGRYGLLVDRSSINGGDVNENKFRNLTYGNQFQNDNIELRAPCNTYDNILANSWRVLEKKQGAGALADQGVLELGQPKADNRFIDPCIGTIQSDIFSSFAFNYFDKAGNTDPADDNCVSSVVNFFVIPDPSVDGCESFFSEPCPILPCNTEERAIYEGSPKGIKDRNQLLRSFLHWDTYEIADTVELIELDSVINILANRIEEADKRLLVTAFLSNEQFSEANLAMTFVSGSDPESIDFMAYHDILIQAGLAGNPWYALPPSTLNNLLAFKNAETTVAENAKTLDYYYNGNYTPLIPLDTIIPPTPFIMPPGDEVVEQLEKTKIYPNPFDQMVTFELAKEQLSTIVITDLLGRELWQYTIEKGERKITWRPNHLNPGTYLYLIRSVDGQSEEGKLLFIR
jgi:hypothetical protein